MVVIFLPTASLTEVWQGRTASPLTSTVQAPHRPAPQPNFVPVICNCSRMTHSSGVSFAASTDIFRPLMLRLGIVSLPLPVHDAAYGGNSLFGIGWHPPVRCQSVTRMIVICSRGNVIWNCSKEIKLPDLALCIAAIKLTQFAAALTPPSQAGGVSAWEAGSFDG